MKAIKPSYEILVTKEQADQMTLNMEKFGRVCYKSEPVQVEDPVMRANKFIKDKISAGHESIIEHEKVTVIIKKVLQNCFFLNSFIYSSPEGLYLPI